MYDSSKDDQIAEGVTVAGVDLGGLTADEARTAINQQVAAPLEKPVVVTSGKRRFTLSAEDAGLNADTDAHGRRGAGRQPRGLRLHARLARPDRRQGERGRSPRR